MLAVCRARFVGGGCDRTPGPAQPRAPHRARRRLRLRCATGLHAAEVEQALWDGVARGLVTADGFAALRSLLDGRGAPSSTGRGLRRRGAGGGAEGRWAIFDPPPPSADKDELCEALAEQLLARWGVVFYDVCLRETLALPWREVVWALRRLEARGVVLGGRFVTGFVGEQYALPEAVDLLATVRRSERRGEMIAVAACDPLNVVGILTPGARVASSRNHRVVYRDGLPVEDAGPLRTPLNQSAARWRQPER
jgi:ATP-dependent helicase Lhr and Lhr-like helicase